MSRKSFLGRFKANTFRFFFGNEIEFGDSVFYSLALLVLIPLTWIATVEKYLHVSVMGSLIIWVLIVSLLWRGYARYKKRRKR